MILEMYFRILFVILAFGICLIKAQYPRPPECGLNGSPDPTNHYPWIVYLEHHVKPGYTSPVTYITKGFLIDRNVVLTSAYNLAIDQFYELRKVHFGDYAHLTENRTATNYESDRYVVNVTKHPEADLALIKFDLPLTFTENVRPICLPDYISDVSDNRHYNYQCSKYTHPHSSETHPSGHATKTNTFVRRWKKQDCDAYYYVLGALLYPWQDCYSELRQDTCTGNLGGPLMYSLGGYVFASGLASTPLTVYQVPANSPTVYVNFMEDQGKLLEWIRHNAKPDPIQPRSNSI